MTAKQANTLFTIGYAVLIAGAIIHIFGIKVGFYMFGVGVLLNTIFRIKLLPRSTDRRIRRLNGQQFIVVAFFIVTAYLIYTQHSAWALPLFIAGVIDFYLTYRYPKADEQDK